MAKTKYNPQGINNVRPGVWYDDIYGLYRERWSKDSVEVSSMAHPAKFARALIRWIYEHCRSEGWLKAGDVVVDPFGGVGLGALDPMTKGIYWVGVEVERHHHIRGNGGYCDGEVQTIETSSATRRGWYAKVDTEQGILYGDAAMEFGEIGAGPGFKTKEDAERNWNTYAGDTEYSDMTLLGFEYKTFKDKKTVPAICGKTAKHDAHDVEGNIRMWKRLYGKMFSPFGDAVLLHGDSRNLVNVLANNAGEIPFLSGALNLAASSPPFLQTTGGTNVTSSDGVLSDPRLLARHSAGNAAAKGYGDGEGQIEAMPEGDFDSAITSPPFTGTSSDGGWQMLGKYADDGKLTVKQVGGDPNKSYPSWDKDRDTSYGHTDGQLADMDTSGLAAAISSPPYADISQSGGTKGLLEHGTGLTQGQRAFDEYGSSEGQAGRMAATDDGFTAAVSSPPYADTRITGKGDEGDSNLRNPDGSYVRGSEGWELRKALGGRYGDQPGQLANMKPDTDGFDLAASSPPFEAVTSDRPSSSIVEGGLRMGVGSMGDGYGEAAGQIGNKFGEDFWTASRLILDNLLVVLKPGSHACFVVKRFVKGGKIDDFPEKWAQLCEAAGFKLVHHHKMWVVEDKGVQLDLFGGEVRKVTERKSFFRRLAEKNGSPRIDFEEVLCCQKPYADGTWDACEHE